MSYSVALIGCGHMGAAHLDEIRKMPEIKISIVCDTSIERAINFKERYGAEKAVTDYGEIMDSDVDIVIAATYPSTHLDILRKCISGKKHILCEKPLAKNREEGEEFVNLVNEHPEIKVLVGHILRHNKTYRKAADMVQRGAIGKPIVMRVSQNIRITDWEKSSRLIEETGPLVDCGVHYIDVMHWFTGAEISVINAVGQRTEPRLPSGAYNYAMMTARFTDGSVGCYETGWGNTFATEGFREFVGPKGRIKIILQAERNGKSDILEYYKFPENEFEYIEIEELRRPTGAQFAHLINMIENNVSANPSIDDVWNSFMAVLSADAIIRGKIL